MCIRMIRLSACEGVNSCQIKAHCEPLRGVPRHRDTIEVKRARSKKREGFYISWGKISSLLSSALVCCCRLRFARAGGARGSVIRAVAVTLQSSERLTGWNTEYAPVSFALMPNETAPLALFCLSSGPRCLADAVSGRGPWRAQAPHRKSFFFLSSRFTLRTH